MMMHMTEQSLLIEGMTCGSCVARVDRALRGVAGVRDAAVNLTTGLARVEVDNGDVSGGEKRQDELIQAVERAGYKARLLNGAAGAAGTLRQVRARGEQEETKVYRRMIAGILFGVPAVAIEMALEHQGFFARRFQLDMNAGYNVFAALLATLVMIFAGWPFFAGAWRALRHRAANMDLLVALGTGVAYLSSVLALIAWLRTPSGVMDAMAGMHSQPALMELHAAVTIVVLVTVGKYLEARAKRRASSAVGGLAAQTADVASRVNADGGIEEVPAEKIAIGDRVQVVAHQKVPVDGEVIEGSGSADLSVVTGESVPVNVVAGAKLPGGATLADGRIVMRATSTAAASTVARILDLVNAAHASKTEIQGLADRVAGIFVPIVLLVAWVTFVAWMGITGNWERGLVATIATIVIACPCAMGLATPTAITVALGTAARMGILFTRASALERAGTIKTVVFDKTGTLTHGRPEVTSTALASDAGMDVKEFLRLAASIEQFSQHPLAQAIVAAANQQTAGAALMEPLDFSSVAGGGVRARMADGRDYAAGSAAFVTSLGIALMDDTFTMVLTDSGQSLVYVGEVSSRRLLGFFSLGDALRPDAPGTLKALRAAGVKTVILSGDSQAAVSRVAGVVGAEEFRAQVRPEEKAAAVAQLKADSAGRPGAGVAFVGDGINDGPALAAADLGIAMAGGTDLARSAGDVLLVGNRLSAVPEVIDLSQRTLRIIRQNLFWAFAYNVAAIPLAMFGILPPGVAAGAMMVSSLTVVGNALRLRTGTTRPHHDSAIDK